MVSISVYWLVAQCNGIDRYQGSEENAVSMFKAEEIYLENGGIIFFREVGTQNIIEFISLRKHCVVRVNLWKCCQ